MARAATASKPDSGRAEGQGTPRGDKTRQALKAVIARLAERKPLSDITLAEICRVSELTTGAVYFHFQSKDDAVEEMIIDLVEHGYAASLKRGAGADFAQSIRIVLENTTKFCRTGGYLPNAIQVTINSRPKAYAAWLAARQPVIDRLAEMIAETRREKGLSADPSQFLATFILNSIEDVALDAFHWRNPNLAPFVADPEQWIAEQQALWTWAILAPAAQPR